MLADATRTLIWAHATLRLRSPAVVLRKATTIPPRTATAIPVVDAHHVARFVGVASRRLVRVPCLSRSVALARMLSRRGVPSDIRIGVRTSDGRLEAHAWVEVNGRPLLEDESTLRTFVPFTEPLGNLSAARVMFR